MREGVAELIMDVMNMLPRPISAPNADAITEIRIRAGRRIQLCYPHGNILIEERLSRQELAQFMALLLDHSVYARENELREGYFTLRDGCRVGVCGRYAMVEGRVESLVYAGSLCIRAARTVEGCAEAIGHVLARDAGGVIILSAPGMGKTTLLRDAARWMSENGMNVAIADERSELAACRDGVPEFFVGERTDVVEACPKSIAMAQLIRSCAPDALVTDELGGDEDVRAVADAARCGIKMVASAHAGSMEEAWARPALRGLLESGAFCHAVVLGGQVGEIREIRTL